MGIRATRLGPCIVSHGSLGSASRAILRLAIPRLLRFRFVRERHDRARFMPAYPLQPGTR
jgi:hypothetical protein